MPQTKMFVLEGRVLFIFFMLSSVSTTVHSALVDLNYQLEVGHPADCGVPSPGCVDGEISGALGFLMDRLPGTLGLRYQYDTTVAPTSINRGIYSYEDAITKVEMRLDDYVLQADGSFGKFNGIHVLNDAPIDNNNSLEDLIAILMDSPITFEFLNGPFLGSTVDVNHLPTSVFRSTDTSMLQSGAIPAPIPLEGWEDINLNLDNQRIIFVSNDGSRASFAITYKTTNIESKIAVPEPQTITLLGFGLAGIGLNRKKKAGK